MKERDPNDITALIDDDYFAVDEQRDQSNEDIRFVDVDGAQYDDWWRDQFSERPKLEFNKIYQAVYDFTGEWRENRFALKYRPEDERASDDDASLLSGLFRKDFYRDNEGTEAVDNAVDEAAKGGCAAFGMRPKYVNDEDPEDDRQIVEFYPLYSACNTVIWDRNSKKPDKSDAKHVTVIESMDRESAIEEWGDEVESAFEPPDRRRFNWNNHKKIHIAYFYEVVEEKTIAYTFEDPLGRRKTVYKEDFKNHIDDLVDNGFDQVREKPIKRRSVYMSIVAGGGYLEKPKRIAGKYLPIIPMYAYRGFIDGQEFWYGIARKYKDANRLFNMALTSVAENAATTQKDMPIFTDEQVEGREQQLREMHLGKYNYAVINPVEDANGESIHAGPVGTWAASRVDPNNAAIATMVGEFMAAGLGTTPKEIEEASLSGVAVDRLKRIIDSKTVIITDNIKKAFHRCGVVYAAIADEIYDSERIEYILNRDGTDKMMRLFDIVVDEKTGEPKFINDVTKKAFAVSVDTGPAYQSQRREAIAGLQEIAEIAPDDYKPLIFGQIIDLMDGVGMDDLKEFNRKRMVQMGIRKPETDEEKAILEAVQQQEKSAQEELLRSMAKREIAEAQELLSNVQKNATQARLNTAKAMKEIAGIKIERFRAANEIVSRETTASTKPIERQAANLDEIDRVLDLEAKRAKIRKDNAETEAQLLENAAVRTGLMDLANGG